MTQAMREALRDALMDGDPPELAKIVEEMVSADIKSIEPVVDDWLAQAEARGRFAGILETLDGATCAPGAASLKCHACEDPASFITYQKAHCYRHRPEVGGD